MRLQLPLKLQAHLFYSGLKAIAGFTVNLKI